MIFSLYRVLDRYPKLTFCGIMLESLYSFRSRLFWLYNNTYLLRVCVLIPLSYSFLESFANRVLIILFVKIKFCCVILRPSNIRQGCQIIFIIIVNSWIGYIIVQKICVYHVPTGIFISRDLYSSCSNKPPIWLNQSH